MVIISRAGEGKNINQVGHEHEQIIKKINPEEKIVGSFFDGIYYSWWKEDTDMTVREIIETSIFW